MKISEASYHLNKWTAQQRQLTVMAPANVARTNRAVQHWQMMLNRLRDIKGRRDSKLPSRLDVKHTK